MRRARDAVMPVRAQARVPDSVRAAPAASLPAQPCPSHGCFLGATLPLSPRRRRELTTPARPRSPLSESPQVCEHQLAVRHDPDHLFPYSHEAVRRHTAIGLRRSASLRCARGVLPTLTVVHLPLLCSRLRRGLNANSLTGTVPTALGDLTRLAELCVPQPRARKCCALCSRGASDARSPLATAGAVAIPALAGTLAATGSPGLCRSNSES